MATNIDINTSSDNSNAGAQWLFVLTIIALGTVFRFQAITATDVIDPIRNDARDYVSYAFNLETSNTFSRTTASNVRTELPEPPPDALRRPAYPLFLSLILNPSDSLDAFMLKAKLSQALLSSISLLLLFFIARQLLGFRYAVLALALTSFNPHIINMNVYLLSEALFIFIELLLFLCIANWRPDSKIKGFIAVGALIAIAALTRAWIQYFIILLIAWMLFSKDMSFNKKQAAIVAFSFLGIFALWTLRNLLTLGITSDSTLVINGLHHGMYPNFMFQGNPDTRGFAYLFDPNSETISHSVGSILEEILRRFQTDFWRHAYWYTWGKTTTLLSWGTIQGVHDIFIYPVTDSPFFRYGIWHWMEVVMSKLHAPLMILACAGSLLVWAPSRFHQLEVSKIFVLRLISLFFVYFLAVHLVTAPFPRYAIPLKPLLFILALIPLKVALHRFRPASVTAA